MYRIVTPALAVVLMAAAHVPGRAAARSQHVAFLGGAVPRSVVFGFQRLFASSAFKSAAAKIPIIAQLASEDPEAPEDIVLEETQQVALSALLEVHPMWKGYTRESFENPETREMLLWVLKDSRYDARKIWAREFVATFDLAKRRVAERLTEASERHEERRARDPKTIYINESRVERMATTLQEYFPSKAVDAAVERMATALYPETDLKKGVAGRELSAGPGAFVPGHRGASKEAAAEKSAAVVGSAEGLPEKARRAPVSPLSVSPPSSLKPKDASKEQPDSGKVLAFGDGELTVAYVPSEGRKKGALFIQIGGKIKRFEAFRGEPIRNGIHVVFNDKAGAAYDLEFHGKNGLIVRSTFLGGEIPIPFSQEVQLSRLEMEALSPKMRSAIEGKPKAPEASRERMYFDAVEVGDSGVGTWVTLPSSDQKPWTLSPGILWGIVIGIVALVFLGGLLIWLIPRLADWFPMV